ncbi:hypothetical protein GE21DRAFT_1122369 [Neurospora crassa]|nr:hypothetical protein GE21DRAFT_1122369 [Neurospora crassa]
MEGSRSNYVDDGCGTPGLARWFLFRSGVHEAPETVKGLRLVSYCLRSETKSHAEKHLAATFSTTTHSTLIIMATWGGRYSVALSTGTTGTGHEKLPTARRTLEGCEMAGILCRKQSITRSTRTYRYEKLVHYDKYDLLYSPLLPACFVQIFKITNGQHRSRPIMARHP